MADDIAALISNCKLDVLEPIEDTAIKRYMVAALKDLRGERFIFTDKTSTFPTVVNQEKYTQGTGSVPVGIEKIDTLYQLVSTNVRLPIQVLPWQEYRRFRSPTASTSNRPEIASFYEEKIWLWPIPSAVVTIEISFNYDSTRDSTGAEITVSTSTSETNPFFAEGEELLRAATLIRWALGRGRSPEMAASWQQVFLRAYSRLKRQGFQKLQGLQAPARF